MDQAKHAAKVLVADDSSEDIFFLSYAFKDAGLPHTLVGVSDGDHAIAYLTENPPPDLFLLDLKMPKVNGFDVLRWIQQQPKLEGLPVVVHSSSNIPEDIKRARDLGAVEYFVKSSKWEALALELDRRWLSGVQPARSSGGVRENEGSCRPADILMVEDDEDDAFMLSRALKKAGLFHALTQVWNGREAIAYLNEKTMPDVLVLDLKMPLVSGFEVLKWIRQSAQLHDLPVIILSGSDMPQDKEMARELGVKGYIVKNADWSPVARDLDAQVREILAATA